MISHLIRPKKSIINFFVGSGLLNLFLASLLLRIIKYCTALREKTFFFSSKIWICYLFQDIMDQLSGLITQSSCESGSAAEKEIPSPLEFFSRWAFFIRFLGSVYILVFLAAATIFSCKTHRFFWNNFKLAFQCSFHLFTDLKGNNLLRWKGGRYTELDDYKAKVYRKMLAFRFF